MSDEPKTLYRHVISLRKKARAALLVPGDEEWAMTLDGVADLCIAVERGDLESVKRIAFGEEETDA